MYYPQYAQQYAAAPQYYQPQYYPQPQAHPGAAFASAFGYPAQTSSLFVAQPTYYRVPQQQPQFVPQGFAPTSAGFPVAGSIVAAPRAVMPTPFVNGMPTVTAPVDLYASAASVRSHVSAASVRSHASAVSVLSHASASSARSAPIVSVPRPRRGRSTYGKWKDQQEVFAKIPMMHNRMPDPFEPPKRTDFKRWKDVQQIFGRLGLK